jgi:hypothetical protein
MIDDYLNDRLEQSECEDFELHYFSCDSCYTALKIQEQLKEKNVQIVLKPKFQLFAFKPLLAFSMFCLLVFSAILLLQRPASDLYPLTLVKPPLFIVPESRLVEATNHDLETFQQAMQFYVKDDFAQALQYLKTIPQTDNFQIAFFTAICHFQLNQSEPAEKLFDWIIEQMNPAYYDDSLFYKSLLLIRQNKITQAKQLLENLAEMHSPLSGKARAILKKM